MASLSNKSPKEPLRMVRRPGDGDERPPISPSVVSFGYGTNGGTTSPATELNADAPDSVPTRPAVVHNVRPTKQRAWSFHEATSLLGDQRVANASPSASLQKQRDVQQGPSNNDTTTSSSSKSTVTSVVYILVYALVNVIISVPGLYGYAAVIFNHPVFAPHMNALSKLVIFSSLIHQLGFTLFSSLPFAIGTVQDAGLIFLSSMSNTLATAILDRDGGTEEQVVSTTLALLSASTAALGLVLVVMGHFRLADAVSYLPMPVVAGYLAYIGYFCLQAGVGLCISKAMTTVMDWQYVLTDADNALLAAPGLLAGLVLTWLSRTATNDAILPGAMVLIPAFFYVVIYGTGIGLEGAREGGWVGEVGPPVPVSDLFQLVNFSAIQWDLVSEIMFTWVGMVFVVSFASCLDVAAISMDMGEALDTNKELSTVGVCNIMSGLTFGFTGSYIFSQTIFTYRTQVHSRWIGICIMVVFFYVVSSPVNILQVAPLFFLGSTLIFIGYDLVYEWLVEIRHKVFLSEYVIVWATFLAIQVVGMDAGIILGVLVAVVDHVVSTAKTTSVYRVNKKSRAVWTPSEHKLLLAQGYNPQSPKIVSLEIVGNVFFGSSLLLLERLTEELGIDLQQESSTQVDAAQLIRSPHTPSLMRLSERRPSSMPGQARKATVLRRSPKFVVLDLTQLSNLDASASRGCFLQLVKMCSKRGITVCAAGATTRVDWMMSSHEVAYDDVEEERIKALFQSRSDPAQPATFARSERILMFLTIFEALEFCENALIHQMSPHHTGPFGGFYPLEQDVGSHSLASIFKRILGCTGEDDRILHLLDGRRFHDQIELRAGQEVFGKDTHSDALYTVLKGTVAVAMDAQRLGEHVYRHRQVVSGAGPVQRRSGSASNLMDISPGKETTTVTKSLWPAGSLFGYLDFLLERPRTFRTVATQEGTIVAKISISQLHLIQNEEPALDALLQRVLLQASILDLANCTCD